jgi:ureidoglycolate lyase
MASKFAVDVPPLHPNTVLVTSPLAHLVTQVIDGFIHRSLIVSILFPDLYARYGQVIESEVSSSVPSASAAGSSVMANQGSAKRINYIAKLENGRERATPNMCVFKCMPRELPFDVKLLECHPHSSQVFIPMNAKERYLVVVANGGDKPDLTTLEAFVATSKQGINYNKGTWHHPMIALDSETDFTCLVWEDGSEGDCTIVTLDESEQTRVIVNPMSRI